MTTLIYAIAILLVLLGRTCSPGICAEVHTSSGISAVKPATVTSTKDGGPTNAEWKDALSEAFKANELAKDGKFTEAYANFDQALTKLGKQNVLSSVVYSFRGMAYLSQGNASKALDDFNAGLNLMAVKDADLPNVKKESQHLDALLRICLNGKYCCCYLLGKYEQAADVNGKLILLSPQQAVMGHLDRAVLYILANRGEQVKKELGQAVVKDPKVRPEADEIRGLWQKYSSLSDSERKRFRSWFDERFNARMKQLLVEHLHRAVASSSVPTSAAGPITRYCDRLSEQIKHSSTASPDLNEPIDLDFEVDRQGAIANVNVAQNSGKAGEAAKKVAIQTLMALKKAEAVPADINCPLRLSIHMSNKLEDVFVMWRDLDLGPYMASLEQAIKQSWTAPKEAESKQVTIVFKVARNGSVLKVQLKNPSGVAAVDQSALDAVAKASPFKPFPDGAPGDLDVEFTFDYKVMSPAAKESVRNKVITADNQSQIWEELKNSPDVSLEEYKVLLQNAQRSSTGAEKTPQLPLGRKVGELIDEQVKVERASKNQFAQEQIMMEDAAAAKDPLRRLIKVEVLKAAYAQSKSGKSDDDDDNCPSSLTLTLRCSNPSAKDVKKYHGVIFFKDGAEEITDVTLVREDGLKAGETKTFSETFSDDSANSGWRRVANTNTENMRILWKPWKITLDDGTLLTGSME